MAKRRALFLVASAKLLLASPSRKKDAPWNEAVHEKDVKGAKLSEAPYLRNPCVDEGLREKFAGLPFCNASLPLEARLDDAISRMNLQEKIGLMNSESGEIDSLGAPFYNWWSEATHGVSHYKPGANNETLYMSNFAMPITTAMSFNRSLWHATARQIAREARAAMNAGNAFSTFWTPVVNMARDPRWGRNVETPGEDPYLSGQYAESFIRGFQEAPEDPRHYLAAACCKHYLANEMEGSTVAGVSWNRHNFDAEVSQRDLADYYLPPFQDCVEKAKVAGLMCSYNAVNGVPSCASDWLIEEVARKEWNFDGYVVSDCDADEDVFTNHKFTKTPEESVAAILKAGTDVDCGGFISRNVKKALDQGLIGEDVLDARVRNHLRTRFRLGHFDPNGTLQRISIDEICSASAKELARDGVAQSASLFKNEGGALPLDAGSVKTVAVIGPQANLSLAMAGYYGPGGGGHCGGEGQICGRACGDEYPNMVDAIASVVPGTTYSSSTDTSAASKLAAAAQWTVLVLGTSLHNAAEGHDYGAYSLELPRDQVMLAEAAANASSSAVIVVMLTAVPLDISALLANPKVGSILHVGQPSVNTFAVADLLFGKRVPAGRAVQTIYPASVGSEISIFDMGVRPGPSSWPRPDCRQEQFGHCPNGTNPGRSHRFYTGEAVVPFGYGLSYTHFTYSLSRHPVGTVSMAPVRRLVEASRGRTTISKDLLSANPAPIAFNVSVKNDGARPADDVVLGFMKPPFAGIDGAPLQILFDFKRVHIPAGETVVVPLEPTMADFTQMNEDGSRRAVDGTYTFEFGVRGDRVRGSNAGPVVSPGFASCEVDVKDIAEDIYL